jgi:hypothetical protein
MARQRNLPGARLTLFPPSLAAAVEEDGPYYTRHLGTLRLVKGF